jgi:fos-like antigen
MALYESRIGNRTQNNNNNNNNNTIIDNNINLNNNYSMPSTTTTESFGNIRGLTQTTVTLTPTTLKNIEESFMEVIPPQPPQHQNQARFVPPLVNISSNYSSNLNNLNNNNIIINNMNTNSNNSNNSNNSDLDYGSDFDSDDSSSQSQSQWNAYIDRNNGSANNKSNNNSKANNKVNGTKTRGTSGRKPLRNDKLTPEEEMKRQQRRERNKQAAARCRKRRMDHTNSLLIETDGLEEKRHALQTEIEELTHKKEELEYILEAHKNNCKLSARVQQIDVKPVVSNGSVISMNTNAIKSRPNTLPISCVYGNQMNETGIPIQTPSNGLFLDSIEGGTGLTPILNASLTPSTLIITPSTITSTTCGVHFKTSSPTESPNSKKLVRL